MFRQIGFDSLSTAADGVAAKLSGFDKFPSPVFPNDPKERSIFRERIFGIEYGLYSGLVNTQFAE